MNKRIKHVLCRLVLFVMSAAGAAAAADLQSVMNLVDAKKISTLEQLLPQLPPDLRSNFAMVNQSHSQQQATREKPRIIMYGADAKLIVTFNGNGLKGSNKLEMIQFNESNSQFEFFELKFPITRDAAGKAIRPEKNPAMCTTCHGTTPHPIWSSYNQWPGVYGMVDDFLVGGELNAFEIFMASRNSMDRYRALEPLPGSPLSPFSEEKRSNLEFRPNAKLGLLLSKYEAKHIAASIRNAGQLSKYAALIAYENERTASLGTSYPSCPSIATPTPLYGGLWTPDDAKRLQAKLEEQRMAKAPKSPPIPLEWDLVKDLYVLLSAESAAAWTLGLEGTTPTPIEFRDGNGTMRGVVASELREEIFARIPGLRPYGVLRSRYAEDISNPRVVRTPYDVAFVKNLDAIGMFISFKSAHQEHCRLLIGQIKRDWF